ncbi:SDR family oxidoreductase [Paenibacillus oenotherae]|uniref:dTDP-4-dehydrorhamnose reductase n=1 Tax=Paenibacillus oenotherae TaxID=1435645 RepID=A0ABS7D4W8_9BACL|nr:SDR family oxidoreductase [Paenibacillus oenotherae]MBW7474980.1 SDR family oxidoreductase [Paenibacillus oenotherae]
MRMLLIGATGMLGQALRQEAASRGYQVIGAARHGADLSLDIRNDGELREIVIANRPDIIINTAALINLLECSTNHDLAYRVNARSVGLLAHLAREMEAYFVQISTDHYYTGGGSNQHAELSEVNLVNDYARTKYAGEAFALTNPDALVVRTNIVGFRGRAEAPTFVEWVIHTLKKQAPITLFDDFYTSSIDVRQFSKILMDVMLLKQKGIVNIASSEVCSKKEFIEKLAKKFEMNISHADVDSVRTIKDGIIRAESLGLDVSLVESLLGYRMPDSDSVIESLYAEYQKGSNMI